MKSQDDDLMRATSNRSTLSAALREQVQVAYGAFSASLTDDAMKDAVKEVLYMLALGSAGATLRTLSAVSLKVLGPNPTIDSVFKSHAAVGEWMGDVAPLFIDEMAASGKRLQEATARLKPGRNA